MGTSLPGAIYSFVSSGIPADATEVLFAADSPQFAGSAAIAFFYDFPLDDTGGVRSFFSGQEAYCSDATCVAPEPPARFLTNGSIVAVPEPGSILFAGFGALVVWWRRR